MLLANKDILKAEAVTEQLKGVFANRFYVQLYDDHYPSDKVRASVLRSFAKQQRVSVVFAPEIRYATSDQWPLFDALFCARLGITADDPHPDRPQNSCQAITPPNTLRLKFPEAIDNANNLANELAFELLPERLVSPPARVPKGHTSESYLKERCYGALLERYQGTALARARDRLEHELTTLMMLGLSDFFLLAASVMDFCLSRGILAQGRGSAAASVVCFLLGITAVDPLEHDLLFERFLHTGKSVQPDIDIDISSSRREEVVAWVEETYPNEAMVCNKVTYFLPSAIQDLGAAFGLPPHLRDALTDALGRDYRGLRPHHAREALKIFEEVLGDAPVKKMLLFLLEKMERGFVRHIAPHSGGVVVSREPLSHYTPLERSSGGIRLGQFDKDDAASLGLAKLDLLGLRMLSTLERFRELVHRRHGFWLDLNSLRDEKEVWEAIAIGDTLGVFQIESPGQMRLSVQVKPKTLADLAVQIALFRPGPIQGAAVHPVVRRMRGLEPVTYLHPSLEPILAHSYGVLLFQDDVLRICVHVAGLSWSEAEEVRKAIGKSEEEADLAAHKRTFVAGALKTIRCSEIVALEIWTALTNFRAFGFCKSHSYAFAKHAYASAWARHHYPAEFFAAVMEEHPGMWSPLTLRQYADKQGIGFARLDINKSGTSYFVEYERDRARLRPPFTAVKGVSDVAARAIVLERLKGKFKNVEDVCGRLSLKRDTLEALARAGAFDAFGERPDLLYHIGRLAPMQQSSAPLFDIFDTPPLELLEPREKMAWDFGGLGFHHHPLHPVDLVRRELLDLAAVPMANLRDGYVTTAGLVVSKQKPPTANGFAFFVLEDGYYQVQVVISPQLWEHYTSVLRDSTMLIASGYLQREGRTKTLKANWLFRFR